MNKTVKTILIVALVLVLIGACIGGFFIWRHNTTYIGRNTAEDIAVKDSGLTLNEIKEIKAEFEKNHYTAWYEVEIETFGMDYDYVIDARTGDILNSNTELD